MYSGENVCGATLNLYLATQQLHLGAFHLLERRGEVGKIAGGGLSSFKMFNKGVIQYLNMIKEGGYTIFKYKTDVYFINTIRGLSLIRA